MTKLTLKPIGFSRHPQNLSIHVPAFDPGPYPPEAGKGMILSPENEVASDLPCFMPEALLTQSLIADEVRFRKEHPLDWHERCWFLLGDVVRDPTGSLWSMVRQVMPARLLGSSRAYFEFSPQTWTDVRRFLEMTGGFVLGWIHTHSLNFIHPSDAGEPEQHPILEICFDANGQIYGNLATLSYQKRSSGLFLSAIDCESARNRGFGGGHQLTCILDSDACVFMENDGDLSKVFGVWGWRDCILKRRSIYIIKDGAKTA